MFLVSLISFVIVQNVFFSFGVIIGILSHLIADSLTVTGISWLYPYGYEKKFYFKGPLNMSNESERNTEKKITIELVSISGFLFLFKSVSVNIFSLEGVITILILIFVGYMLFKNFDKIIKKIIRNFNI